MLSVHITSYALFNQYWWIFFTILGYETLFRTSLWHNYDLLLTYKMAKYHLWTIPFMFLLITLRSSVKMYPDCKTTLIDFHSFPYWHYNIQCLSSLISAWLLVPNSIASVAHKDNHLFIEVNNLSVLSSLHQQQMVLLQFSVPKFINLCVVACAK